MIVLSERGPIHVAGVVAPGLPARGWIALALEAGLLTVGLGQPGMGLVLAATGLIGVALIAAGQEWRQAR